MEFLKQLTLDRLIEIVDVGAADLADGAPAPYAQLIDAGAARVTGFEPNPKEFAKLNQSDNRRYLCGAVGDGETHDLHMTRHPGFCSFLNPNASVISHMRGLPKHMEVIEKVKMATQRLDDIPEIDLVDFLKIDIQGCEVAVFKGGRTKLENCLMVQTEVAFWPIYEGQPKFGEQERILSNLGFQFFGMVSVNRFRLNGIPRNYVRRARLRDVGPWIDGDALFVRRVETWNTLSNAEIYRMIALFGSVGIALSAIAYLAEALRKRGEMDGTQVAQLLETVSAG